MILCICHAYRMFSKQETLNRLSPVPQLPWFLSLRCSYLCLLLLVSCGGPEDPIQSPLPHAYLKGLRKWSALTKIIQPRTHTHKLSSESNHHS